MPTLKDLVCHVQWADTNSAFPEYGTIYGDGLVETFIAIPNHPQAFTVRLTSRKFIFEGLAMIVFIDGNYQCNRNRVNLQPPKKGLPRNRTEIDFTVRQKEKPLGDGTYMGRDWRFDDYNVVSQLPEGVSESHFDELGTIEVLVLRCRSDNPEEAAMSTTSSGEDSDCLGGGDEDNVDEGAPGSENTSQEDGKSSKGAEPETEGLGRIFGMFDGAFDQPPFSHVSHGDAPADGYSRWDWLHPQDGQPAPYGPQEGPPYQPTHHHRPSFRNMSPALEDPYQQSTRPFSRPPTEYGPPRLERHVHFDYGDGRDPHYATSHSAYGPRLREYEELRWGSGGGYHGHRSAHDYSRASNPRHLDPNSDYPPYHDRHYEYNAGHRDYSDHPRRHPEYERYRPAPPPVAPTFASRPAFQNSGTLPGPAPVNPFQPAAAHLPGPPAATAPGTQQYPSHPAIPVWVPPVAVPIPPPFPGTVPIYPPQNNAPLFHTQAPAATQVGQNGAHPTVAPPGQTSGQPNVESSWQAGGSASQPGWNNQPNNGQHTEPAGSQKDTNNSAGWQDNGNPDSAWAAGGGGANGNDTSGNNADWNKTDNNNANWNTGDNNDNQNASWDNSNNDKPNDGDDWQKSGASNGCWDQNDQNQAGNAGWQDAGSNTGPAGGGWNDDKANNSNNQNEASGGWNNDQNNNVSGNTADANWGNSNNNNPPTVAPAPAANGPGIRALYGPYGAYYTSKMFAEDSVPADAEEEPRYDVPQAVAQAKGTSKQVQPGKGYLYNKKRCLPEYIDNLDEPYARFVFKYRTKEQIKNETGIEVDVEPTGDQEVNDLANLDKAELIQLVLRAKGALGGTIPSPPPKASTPASIRSLEQVPVAPPEFEFLKYKLPPARNAALTGLGIRVSNPPSGQNSGGGPARQDNNSWKNGADNWANGDNQQQQNSTTDNNQGWSNEAPGWDNNNANTGGNEQGWDGQQESGAQGSRRPSSQPNATWRKDSEQPKSVRSSAISPKNTSRNNPPGWDIPQPSGFGNQGGGQAPPGACPSVPVPGISFHGAGTTGGGQTMVTGAGPRPPTPPRSSQEVPELSPEMQEGYLDERLDPPQWGGGNVPPSQPTPFGGMGGNTAQPAGGW